MSEMTVRERLLHDVAVWQTDGLISGPTAAQIRQRYDQRAFGLGQVMRYLGTIGIVFVILGILGLVAATSGSETLTGLLLLALGGGIFVGGMWLTRDELGRYQWSSKFVMTVASITLAAGIAVILNGFGIEDATLAFATGLIIVPALAGLAYFYRIPVLLTMAVLALFHWVGSWTSMFGRSTYALDIQDPRLMVVAALGVFAVGLWHERELRHDTGRFYRIYQSISLVYFNMSLLVLSIEKSPSPWVAVLTVATIAQVVAGARLQNRLLVGFGVTFLFINLFTRYYENFWDTTSKGVFFLIGGVLTFAAGVIIEWAIRQRRAHA